MEDNTMKVLFLVLGIAAVGIMYMAWQQPMAVTKAVKETETPGNAQVIGKGCPSTMKTTAQIASYESIVGTDGAKDQVTDAEAKVYSSDSKDSGYGVTALDTIPLTNGLATSTSGSEIECGDYVKMYVGKDNGSAGGYYYTQVGPLKAQGQSVKIDDKSIHKVGDIQVQFSNSTGSVGYDTGVTASTSAGMTNREVTLKVQEKNGDTYRKPTVCFDYDNTNLDTVEVSGAEKVDKPDRLASSQGTIDCYKLPETKSWDYDGQQITFPGLANGQFSNEYPLKIVAESDASAADYTIDVTVMDEGTYIKNGQLKTGYEDASDNNVGGPDWTAADITATIA